MSSAVNQPAITIQERSAQATRELCAALGLGTLSATNLKYLTVALAQAATQEATRNIAFGEQITTLYKSLLPVKPRAPRRKRPLDNSWKVPLTSIGTVDETELDPYGPPNPFALRRLYGDEQLPLALGRYSLTKLKEAIAVVQTQYPGTKPKKLTKAGIIDYVVGTLTQPARATDGQFGIKAADQSC